MAKEETKKTSTKKTTTKKSTKAPTKKTTIKKEVAEKKATPKKTTPAPKKEVKNKTSIVQEENHYGRTLLAAILIVIVVVGGYLAVEFKKNGGSLKPTDKYVATEAEKAFKEEYESLNGTTRSNGEINKEISIIEDNKIVYITPSEAAEILDSGTGVIYFGFAACPWCRSAVPVLLNAMKSSELDKIYYVNVRPDDDTAKDIRDTYILDSRNKPKKSKEAEKAYYDIIFALAGQLDDYVLTTEKGSEVNIGEKRLVSPTVVAVNNGYVVGFHSGTVKDHVKEDGKLRDLTNEEETELLNTYSEMISKYLNSDCSVEKGGC